MANRVNGFWTFYYGERDYRPDGSYLTTLFFCVLYFPIFPLRSERVIPDPNNMEWTLVGPNYYLVLEKRRPHLLQVASVYLCSWTMMALAIDYVLQIGPQLQQRWPWLSSPWVEPIPMLLMVAPVFVLIRMVRRNAKRKALAQNPAETPAPIG